MLTKHARQKEQQRVHDHPANHNSIPLVSEEGEEMSRGRRENKSGLRIKNSRIPWNSKAIQVSSALCFALFFR
jgi:hypothetical protein